MIPVALYLSAAVVGNLLVVELGPDAVPVVSFLFIGLDLTVRDLLHERWHERNLAVRMALLILSGAAISFLLTADALRIGLASFVAFVASATVDTIAYQWLLDRDRLTRVNLSNILSAAVDSIVFPLLAFGEVYPEVMVASFGAKVIGGFGYSLGLRRWLDRERE